MGAILSFIPTLLTILGDFPKVIAGFQFLQKTIVELVRITELPTSQYTHYVIWCAAVSCSNLRKRSSHTRHSPRLKN